jgi:hypothetical protein
VGIPEHMLPHTVTLVRPATATDNYGNTTYDYGVAATRTSITAWLQQDKRSEPISDGRDPLIQWWLLITNHEDICGRDRIEHDSTTYDVEGPPEKVYTPSQLFHHTEATLKAVAG